MAEGKGKGKGSGEVKGMKLNVNVDNIVRQMSPEVRREAEKVAWARKQSLNQFVREQVMVQLSEQEFTIEGSAVRFDSWDISADSRPTDGSVRVGGGIRGRF